MVLLKIDKRYSQHMSVCGNHFHISDYRVSLYGEQTRFLKEDALPSRNLPMTILELKGILKRKLVRRSTRTSAKSIGHMNTIDLASDITNENITSNKVDIIRSEVECGSGLMNRVSSSETIESSMVSFVAFAKTDSSLIVLVVLDGKLCQQDSVCLLRTC
ncbi:hypothetical protein Bhyg_07939 [Pseudolycoriella hygida]|uniref:Uncharacterized protein n=1 Tax=Pseudolycoriella hygida TaxID=35572 RepID=A0A9Q0N3N2_9DIPT|nr:hypothetical protein Bhyg_07939 [Pseudolycoriella hygida]